MSQLKNLLLCCAVIAQITQLVSSVAIPKAFSTPSPECFRKCARCPPTPQCAPGVSLVTDDCGCCKTCARQLGETCNRDLKCDSHKNLYCSYSDVDETESFCAAIPGRSCYSGGNTYVNGESFDIGCKFTCTCIDGYLGCVPKCPITIAATPPKNCLHPRLVRRPNQCCEEWMCTGSNLNNTTSTNTVPSSDRRRIISHVTRSRPQHVYASAKRLPPVSFSLRPHDKCKVQTTQWSDCSKTCGWGVSERVTNDNKACKLRKQTRLCQLRPCASDFLSIIKRGKKCSRTVKSQQKVRYSFSSCQSKVYMPKYCGSCIDGRCCTPKHTVTRAIRFTCPDGYRFKKRMMVIRSCQCKRSCPSTGNDVFSFYRRLSGDTWRN